MKKFYINYKHSLGGFLDEKGYNWGTELKKGAELIYIYCKDSAELFSLACEYMQWYLTEIDDIK